MRRTGQLLALGILVLALAPTPALAKRHKHRSVPPAVAQVYYDCGHHNSLTHHYPLRLLQQAYADLPSDAKEYSLCPNEILNAEEQQAAGNRPLPQASQQQRQQAAQGDTNQLNQARKRGAGTIDLGGSKIPAAAVTVGGSALSDLPTPLLVVLVALIAVGSVPLALRASRFVRSRRSR